MESETKSFYRHPAVKITIKELEDSNYVEEQNQNPHYILTADQKKIFRVNVLGIIVHKELRGTVNNLLIDDGTEKIMVRFFEENKNLLDLEVGEIVLILGRVREYQKEKYILPEIVKKTNSLWLKVRARELQIATPSPESLPPERKNTAVEAKKEKDEIIIEEDIEDNLASLPFQKIIKLITDLDRGDGVFIEELLEQSPLKKTEELLEKMLENGNIFQNLPGKVRVL